MKFKTKQELKKEQKKLYVNPDCAFQFGIDVAFESFTERKEFYEKYRCLKMWKGGYNNHLGKMKEEAPKLYVLYWKFNEEIGNDISKYKNWNTWLFNHCFGDLIK